MSEINLLPWREKKKARQSRRFAALLVMLLLISVYGHFLVLDTIDKQISSEQKQAQAMSLELDKLNQEVGNLGELRDAISELDKQILLVEEVNQGRGVPLALLAALSETIPTDTFIDQIAVSKQSIMVAGVAEKAESVTLLKQLLSSETQFSDFNVHTVSKESGIQNKGFYRFELRLIFGLEGGD